MYIEEKSVSGFTEQSDSLILYGHLDLTDVECVILVTNFHQFPIQNDRSNPFYLPAMKSKAALM